MIYQYFMKASYEQNLLMNFQQKIHRQQLLSQKYHLMSNNKASKPRKSYHRFHESIYHPSHVSSEIYVSSINKSKDHTSNNHILNRSQTKNSNTQRSFWKNSTASLHSSPQRKDIVRKNDIKRKKFSTVEEVVQILKKLIHDVRKFVESLSKQMQKFLHNQIRKMKKDFQQFINLQISSKWLSKSPQEARFPYQVNYHKAQRSEHFQKNKTEKARGFINAIKARDDLRNVVNGESAKINSDHVARQNEISKKMAANFRRNSIFIREKQQIKKRQRSSTSKQVMRKMQSQLCSLKSLFKQ